jgi:hypothetical protein
MQYATAESSEDDALSVILDRLTEKKEKLELFCVAKQGPACSKLRSSPEWASR